MAHQELEAAVRQSGCRAANPKIVVGQPTHVVARVLGLQLRLAGLEPDPVKVKHLAVAFVHGN